MIVSEGDNVSAVTIAQIKQQSKILAQANETDGSQNKFPIFWITDWLLHVLDKSALFLMTNDEYQLNTSEVERFRSGVTKMQQGTPLAYLTGHQEFWSLSFRVNEHTLIPRPDTEVLVEQVLSWINSHYPSKPQTSKRLLDLGTGSGCIAISLAHELNASKSLNAWQVTAIDSSAAALKIAHENAIKHQTDIEFILSHWYDKLPIPTHNDALFEVIVSNPPYIDEADEHLQGLQAEPMSALSAPNKGLGDIEHIVKQASTYLRVGGLLAIEHGYDQGSQVYDIFVNRGFERIKTIKDYAGNDRVTLGQLK